MGSRARAMRSRDDDAEERVDEETVGGGAQSVGDAGKGAGSDEEEEGTRARAGTTTREGEGRGRVCSLSDSPWCSTRRDGCVMRWDAMRMVSSIVSSRAGAVRWRTRGLTRIFARARFVFRAGHGRAGQMSVDVIVKQLELLRGKVSSEEDLSDVLGFNVKADLVGRADSAGLVSVGAIGNVLYRGLSKSKSARTLSSDRERFEDVLERRAVKNISKVLGHGDGDDAIITTKDLKAKLRYYGVHSSVTDIISMMTQADIDGTGIVRVGDLSRLLAQELAQLRRLLTEKTETTVNDRFRVSLDMDREDGAATNRLLRGEAEFGVLQSFPARSDREKPKRLVWAKEDDMCSVCLFDKSGAMMIEEQGQLVSLPAKLDYFTDVDRGVENQNHRRTSRASDAGQSAREEGVVQLLLLVVSPHRLDLSAFNIVCN